MKNYIETNSVSRTTFQKKKEKININDVMRAEIITTFLWDVLIVLLVLFLAIRFSPFFLFLFLLINLSEYDQDIKKRWLEQNGK